MFEEQQNRLIGLGILAVFVYIALCITFGFNFLAATIVGAICTFFGLIGLYIFCLAVIAVATNKDPVEWTKKKIEEFKERQCPPKSRDF